VEQVNGSWGVALAAGVWAVSYPALFRHRCLTWGRRPTKPPGCYRATNCSPLPTSSRRAPLRSTPAGRSLALAGPDGQRPGWRVHYDWIENLFGLGMHSAREVLPRFQDVNVGDEMQLGPNRPKMRVEVLDVSGCSRFGLRTERGCGSSRCFRPRSDQAGQ
jgi:hypothetical protein